MPNSVSKQDWENFRAMGRVPKAARAEIIASWQRSSHLARGELKRAPLLVETDVQQARFRSSRFMRAAQPAVQKAGYLLNRSGNMILLCDPQGLVIDQVGDPYTLDMGRENHLYTGGRWREEDIGTNAIGMALLTGMPVQVFRAEHFSEEIQRWSCSATPVCDPVTERILGVVDVSWPADAVRSDAGALSAILAVQAETMLRQMLMVEREKLAETANLRRLRRGNAPVAMLDRYGLNVLSTDNFLRAFDDDGVLDHLRAVLLDLMDQPEEQMVSALQGLLPGMDLEVMRDGGEGIGLLLSKRQSRPAMAPSRLDLKTIGQVGEVMARISSQAARLAGSHLPILIEGETGAGKSTLAEAIHQAGSDPNLPFVRLDCAMLTAEGLVDQLSSAGGTLCLESPAACPLDAQKLLLGLVEQAAGAGMRIITTSTRSLGDEAGAGRFRSDLYYRLAVARIALVALRDRRDEIVPHLRAITRQKAGEGRSLNFTPAALAAITDHDWPGNLREMSNLVDLLLAVTPNGLIDHRSLPPEFSRAPAREGDTLRDGERAQILEAIERAQGNMTEVARRLGIARSTLYLKLHAYRIARPRRG